MKKTTKKTTPAVAPAQPLLKDAMKRVRTLSIVAVGMAELVRQQEVAIAELSALIARVSGGSKHDPR